MKPNTYYKQIESSDANTAPRIFYNMCVDLIDQVDSGETSMTEACYQIAGTMFLEQVERNDNLLSLAAAAGKLELPDHHLPKNRATMWNEFKDDVKELNNLIKGNGTAG